MFYLRRQLLSGCTALITVGVAGWLSAAPITGVTTLQDLINTGATGVTLGGLRFYNFAYTGTAAGGGSAPQAWHIGVSDAGGFFPITSGESPVGFRFTFGWNAIDGEVVDSVITYRVAAVDPRNSIVGINIQFNGTAFPVGLSTFAAVTETVQRSDGQPVAGVSPMGMLNLFNDGSGGLTDTNSQKLYIAPSTELLVTKDMILRSGIICPSAASGGVATVSFLDNGFVTVPEPGSGVLILGAVIALGLARGRSTRPA